MIRKPLSAAILAALSIGAFTAQSALAIQEGDFIVRAGFASVQPDVDSGGLQVNGAEDKSSTADVDDNIQIGLAFTYMFTDSIGVELLAATPFQHTLTGEGGLAGLGDFADVKHLPPTLSVQYYPLDKGSDFQPYFGLGLNYTFFFSEDFKGAADAAFKDLELDSSLGLTGQVGFDYRFSENWSVNAAVWYMDINTTAEFKDNDNTRYKMDVELDPLVYMAGLSYAF